MAWAALAGVLWGLSTAASAATMNVTVAGGTVTTARSDAAKGADDGLTFQLVTPGYSFPATDAVTFTGGGTALKCTTTSKTTVSCGKAGKATGGKLTYVVRVQAAGASAPVESQPNIWVQSD
jgi:hypothetical protein